jgi:hypothetical protein
MAKLVGDQLSLIAEEEEEDDRPIGDWGYEKLGTKNSLVPNFPTLELGTKKFLVPNSADSPTWREKFDGQYLEDWKPKIGCLDRKWVKDHQYWCWRYYDIDGKKRAIHLHKDYTKAVRKAVKIGIPIDAKTTTHPVHSTDIESTSPPRDNLINYPQTAHRASRTAHAA